VLRHLAVMITVPNCFFKERKDGTRVRTCPEPCPGRDPGRVFFLAVRSLEKSLHITRFNVHIDPSVGRIRTGSRHEADGAGHRAEELRAGKDQDIAHRESPSLGNSLAVGSWVRLRWS